MFTREQIKVELKRKGWSYREAALELGCTYQHVSYVLNGHRESRSLLIKINRLSAKK